MKNTLIKLTNDSGPLYIDAARIIMVQSVYQDEKITAKSVIYMDGELSRVTSVYQTPHEIYALIDDL